MREILVGYKNGVLPLPGSMEVFSKSLNTISEIALLSRMNLDENIQR